MSKTSLRLLAGFVLFFAVTVRASDTVIVRAGTQLPVRLTSALSSATAHTGDMVTMEAIDDVLVDKSLVISRGAVIVGKVTVAKAAGRVGKSGKLGIALNTVKAVDGTLVPLRSSSQEKKGKGGYGAGSYVGVAATGLLFWPAGPLWLLKHGHDIDVPVGTLFMAEIASDASVDTSKTPPRSVETIQQPARMPVPAPKATPVTAPQWQSPQEEPLGDVARRVRQQRQAAKQGKSQ